MLCPEWYSEATGDRWTMVRPDLPLRDTRLPGVRGRERGYTRPGAKHGQRLTLRDERASSSGGPIQDQGQGASSVRLEGQETGVRRRRPQAGWQAQGRRPGWDLWFLSRALWMLGRLLLLRRSIVCQVDRRHVDADDATTSLVLEVLIAQADPHLAEPRAGIQEPVSHRFTLLQGKDLDTMGHSIVDEGEVADGATAKWQQVRSWRSLQVWVRATAGGGSTLA